jgi:hypothetical protein
MLTALHRIVRRVLVGIYSCWATLVVVISSASSAAGQAPDTIVKLAGTPLYPGVATLTQELRIGMTDGPEEYLFTFPSEILLQRDGSIVVLDWETTLGTPIVRRYDRNGRFLRRIGGRGRGPGEYREPTGLAELNDGRILLADALNGRINVYSRFGESVGTWNARGNRAIARGPDWLKVSPDGMVYLRFVRAQRPLTPEIAILRLRSDGAIVDTLLPPFLPDTRVPRVTVKSPSGRATYGREVPYWPRSIWTLTHDGFFLTATTDRYAINLIQGRRITSIRRSIQPVTVSTTERNEQRSYTAEWLRTRGKFTGSVPDVPRTKPFFKWITTDQDGRIWVWLSTASERYNPPPPPHARGTIPVLRWREPALFDVFESDGTYIGQVAVPERVELKAIHGDVAWAVVRDEDDVPSVVRYRIAWSR